MSVPTPGGVVPPPGVLPGWDWTPSGGLACSPQDLPRWVRTWLVLPLVDRYAHAWMWHHGLYSLVQPPPRGGEDGDPSGDRSPRGPSGPRRGSAISRSSGDDGAASAVEALDG